MGDAYTGNAWGKAPPYRDYERRLNLYILAAEERWDKVMSEINRATLARLRPGLPKICRFISYSDLKQELEEIGSRIKYIKPDFIDEIAESCEIEEA